MTTAIDVPLRTELKRKYGDPAKPSLFLSQQGFLDEGSPATFCKLMHRRVAEEMENLGYSHDTILFYSKGAVSAELFDVLFYLHLEDVEDEGTNKQFYQAHMWGDYSTKPMIQDQYYHQTMVKLIDHVDSFLQSLDELERIAEYGSYGANGLYPRLPLILRHNEFMQQVFLNERAKHAPLIGS